MQQEVLLTVERQFANHRSHDAQVIGNFRKMWKKVADPQSALTVLLELPRTPEPNAVCI